MLVLPIIRYSSFLWSYKAYSDIEKIQNNLMRSFLGVGRNAPIVLIINNIVSKKVIYQKMQVTACVHVYLRVRAGTVSYSSLYPTSLVQRE